MLKKDNKITKKKEFDFIFKKGKSSFDNIIGVRVIKNNLNNKRFGIIVGTKVSKKAVERNRIKRRIKTVLVKEISKIKQSIDCIIISLPQIKTSNYKDIQISLQNHLKNLIYFNKNFFFLFTKISSD